MLTLIHSRPALSVRDVQAMSDQELIDAFNVAARKTQAYQVATKMAPDPWSKASTQALHREHDHIWTMLDDECERRGLDPIESFDDLVTGVDGREYDLGWSISHIPRGQA